MKPLAALCLFLALSLCRAAEPAPTVTLSLQTPHPGFALRALRAVRKDGTTYILARVIAPPADRMYPMVIGEASVTIVFTEPPGQTRLCILGKTWNWGDESAITLADEAAFDKLTAGGSPLPFNVAAAP